MESYHIPQKEPKSYKKNCTKELILVFREKTPYEIACIDQNYKCKNQFHTITINITIKIKCATIRLVVRIFNSFKPFPLSIETIILGSRNNKIHIAPNIFRI
jgi:hypothetical protein